jgi:hypothetical protein
MGSNPGEGIVSKIQGAQLTKKIFLGENIFFLLIDARGAASNSAYYGYPELWILGYPAQRYHAVL